MKEQYSKMNHKKLALLRMFLSFQSVLDIAEMFFTIQRLINPQNSTQQIFECIYWILELTVIGCLLMSKKCNELNFIYPSIFAILLKISLSMFDRERKIDVLQFIQNVGVQAMI